MPPASPRDLVAVEPFVRFHLMCHDVGVRKSFTCHITNSSSHI